MTVINLFPGQKVPEYSDEPPPSNFQQLKEAAYELLHDVEQHGVAALAVLSVGPDGNIWTTVVWSGDVNDKILMNSWDKMADRLTEYYRK